MDHKPKINSGLIFEFIVFGLALGIIIMSAQYGLGSLKKPGAGLYTLVIGSIILIFSTMNFFLSGKRSKNVEAVFKSKVEIKKFLFMSMILIFWLMGMPYLGYTLITFIATFLISKVIELEGYLKPLILAIGVSSFIYVIFHYLFYIDLPRGFWG